MHKNGYALSGYTEVTSPLNAKTSRNGEVWLSLLSYLDLMSLRNGTLQERRCMHYEVIYTD